MSSWRNTLPLIFLVTSSLNPALLWGQEPQVIDWQDLVGTFEFEDPFAALSRGQLVDLGIVARCREQQVSGERVSDAAKQEMEDAVTRLQGVDIDDLLARRFEIAELRRKRATAANTELKDQLIKMPGYALPLEFDGSEVVEFLLVPWVGACIHTPPPPPNQIIYVTVEAPFRVESQFEPVWVQGVLEIGALSKNLYLIDGSSDVNVGYSISSARVEEYRPAASSQ